jgi:ABC-type lipoprotein release transport system permease subunit
LAGEAIRNILIGVSPFDPPTLLAVATGLAVITLLSCYLAARSAANIEPAILLREQA